ncbi:MAG: thermonuclease family protein [Erythrobacter sp.]|nr:MAG: thermonuclease family protein [Erythrobacter sp.]
MIAELVALTLACSVTDGDTIRCGDERIRITGIDAPETRACRQGRQCVAGDGQASKRALEALVDGAALSIVRLGQDRYGRTLAVVYADGANIACAQLADGQAHYVARWDDDGLVAADCPALTHA